MKKQTTCKCLYAFIILLAFVSLSYGQTKKEIPVFTSHIGDDKAVISGDSKYLITIGILEHTIKKWSLETGELVSHSQIPSIINSNYRLGKVFNYIDKNSSIDFNPVNYQVAFIVEKFDTNKDKRLGWAVMIKNTDNSLSHVDLIESMQINISFPSISYTPDGNYLIIANSEGIQRYNLAKKQFDLQLVYNMADIQESRLLFDKIIAISSTECAIVCKDNGNILIYDLVKGKLKVEIKKPEKEKQTQYMNLSADGSQLYVTGYQFASIDLATFKTTLAKEEVKFQTKNFSILVDTELPVTSGYVAKGNKYYVDRWNYVNQERVAPNEEILVRINNSEYAEIYSLKNNKLLCKIPYSVIAAADVKLIGILKDEYNKNMPITDTYYDSERDPISWVLRMHNKELEITRFGTLAGNPELLNYVSMVSANGIRAALPSDLATTGERERVIESIRATLLLKEDLNIKDNTLPVCDEQDSLINMVLAWDIDRITQKINANPTSKIALILGKPYIEWINNTPIAILEKDGFVINKKRYQNLTEYQKKNSTIPEQYRTSSEKIEKAITKLLPLSRELYYMNDSTLLANAEQAIDNAKILGHGSAIMAVPDYSELAKRHPKDHMLQFKLAETYLLAGYYTTANQYYQKVLSLKPNYAPALYGQLMCLVTPFQNAELGIDDKFCSDVIAAANKLNTAGAEYLEEKTNAQIASSLFKLYLSDKAAYEAYTAAQKTTGAQARINAFESVLPMLKLPNNAMLVASTKYILAGEYLMLGGANADATSFIKVDGLLKEAIAGGLELPKVYLLRFKIYDQFMGKPDEAKLIVKAGRTKFPKDKELLKLDGEFLFLDGKTQFNGKLYTQAIVSLEQYMKTSDEPAIEAYIMLGYAYLQTKNNTKALTNLNAAKNRFTSENTALAYYPNLNALLDYAKNPSGTVPELTDNSGKINELHEKMKQVVATHASNFSGAITMLVDIEKQSKEMGYYYGVALANQNMGILYFDNKQFDKAIACYKISMEINPNVVNIYIDLARIYMKQKKYNDAIEILDKANKQFPNHVSIQMEYANVWADWGYEVQSKNKTSEAIDNFKKSLSYNDYNAHVHMALGLAYYAYNNKHPNIGTEINKALELDPTLEDKFPTLKNHCCPVNQNIGNILVLTYK